MKQRRLCFRLTVFTKNSLGHLIIYPIEIPLPLDRVHDDEVVPCHLGHRLGPRTSQGTSSVFFPGSHRKIGERLEQLKERCGGYTRKENGQTTLWLSNDSNLHGQAAGLTVATCDHRGWRGVRNPVAQAD